MFQGTSEKEPLNCISLIGNYTQKRIQELLIYCPECGIFWRRKTLKVMGHEQLSGYVTIQVGGIRFPAHKLAWFYMYNTWYMLDHINGIKWDNRIVNLRPTTYSLNAANRSSSSGGPKGVHFRNGRYEVTIKVNQKAIYLGIYTELEEAKRAYIKAAKEYFGEFARG